MDAWVQAAQNAGFPYNADYNGADQYGVGYFQLTAQDGLRCSAAKAYLKPIRDRKNLEIFTNVMTEKVVFDGKRAIGIQGARGGQSIVIKARNEVVLSAGAIGSPQILMLSGIGPAGQLAEHGIDVRHAM